MKTNVLSGLIFLLCLYGCHSSIAPNEDVPALQERFHGKYKPVQVIASEAIDVNLDGKSSTNLMTEFMNLATIHMQISIIGKNKYVPNAVNLFTQFWPEQYLTKVGGPIDGPVDYDPNIFVNYAEQPVSVSCYFNQQLTEITLAPEENPVPNLIHGPRPDSIKIVSDQQIRVVNRRQLYTRIGWKTVTITTLYERYQKTT